MRETCRLQGDLPLEYLIEAAIAGHHGQPAPSLWVGVTALNRIRMVGRIGDSVTPWTVTPKKPRPNPTDRALPLHFRQFIMIDRHERGPQSVRSEGLSMTRRPDVQGLRAIAVTLVILYHAGAGLSGGFIGVDIFFVISGFVITRTLAAELDDSGSISLRRFYARRFLRILPAAAFTGVATISASYLILSPLEMGSILDSAQRSSVFILNLDFAFNSVDYGLGDLSGNPLLHYWTLSTEEQFYAIWPLILLTATFLGARSKLCMRLVAGTLIACAIVSLALAIVYTERSQPLAFFLLPFRYWEFAVGGALAWLGRERPVPTPVTHAAPVFGAILIVFSAVSFDGLTDFPGPAALIPVLGTSLIIAAGPQGGVIERVLCSRGMGWVGDRSYSLYLWHWPVLALGGILAPDARWPYAVGLVSLSVVLACFSYSIVENPIRSSRRLRSAPRHGLMVGAASSSFLLLGASALSHATADSLSRPPQLELSQARADEPSIAGCELTFSSTAGPECAFGTGRSGEVYLFGDSHAAQLLPAVLRIAKQRDWTVLLRSKDACPPVSVTLYEDTLRRAYVECSEWRERTISEIVASRPRLVVLAAATGYVVNETPRGQPGVSPGGWVAGVRNTTERLSAGGVRAVWVHGTPEAGFDIPLCHSRRESSVMQPDCTIERSEALDSSLESAIGRGVRVGGGLSISVAGTFCSAEYCPPRVHGKFAYRDSGHITAAASRLLAPQLNRAIRDWLTSRTPNPVSLSAPTSTSGRRGG